MSDSPIHARRLMGVQILTARHPALQRLRRQVGQATHHGHKFWGSSLVLMDYLSEFPLPMAARTLELGCGWGAVSLYCAQHFSARATGLDVDPGVLPFAQLHAEINGVEMDLDVGDYGRLSLADFTPFDAVLGADICFWDHLERPLYRALERAVAAGARVVVADPGRPPFLAAAERACDRLGGALESWAVPNPYNVSGFVLDVPPAF